MFYLLRGLAWSAGAALGVWCAHTYWYARMFGAHISPDVAYANLVYLDEYRTKRKSR